MKTELIRLSFVAISLCIFLCIAGCNPDEGTSSGETESNEAQTNEDEDDEQSPILDEASRNSAGEPESDQSGSFSSRALMWNVESEGASGEVIATELAALAGYEIVALTEVLPEDVSRFEKACGEGFKSVWTRTGNNDRMQIIYDSGKFELIRHFELDDINYQFRYRSPLVTHLRNTESGYEFLVMVNHLARGKEEVRQEQAAKLVDWARGQTLPVLALGDYNFDYVFESAQGNEAFRIFMRDGIYKWLKPAEMIDTNWYDPEGDGEDNYPGSMLDFAFVAQQAMDWDAEFKVIVRDGDFPDDSTTSDHRPCEVIFSVN
ncbi:MAG: hypothetical protein AAF456_19910 [Planctomycetota bacterium]